MTTTSTEGVTRLPGYATLFPGYFALVMATGIVSIACAQHGYTSVAKALLWLNVAFYAVLWALTVARAVRFPKLGVADLTAHHRGAAFLTVVAGTNVLGSQFALLLSWKGLAFALWLVGAALWTLLLYGFFVSISVRVPKPSLDEGLNGTWLLMIVATESIAVLGALIAPSTPWPGLVLFLSAMAHLVGLMLYMLVIGLIVYRWTFLGMTSAQVTPPYWINMGALAITTLAAANLIGAAPSWSTIELLKPFFIGTLLLAWSFATWWIPVLVVMGIWRHGVQREALRYDPQYWSLVFPLGMYAACTFKVQVVLGAGFLSPISEGGLIVAALAWLVTLGGMGVSLARSRH